MPARGASDDTDQAWERVARDDPYWGVLSHEEYQGVGDSDARLEEFWASGEVHIQRMFDIIGRHVAPGFTPRSALDFGCGVGRLLVPLAARADEVYGVDVSSTMRSLAARHLSERTDAKVTLAASLDDLGLAPGALDFVHSTLVFQHIRRPLGERRFAELVSLLGPGGCGAVHVFLGRRAAWWRRAVGTARARSRVVNMVVSASRGTFTTEALPYEMNAYDLRRLLVILSDAGIGNVWVESDVRPNAVDVTLFFQRPPT